MDNVKEKIELLVKDGCFGAGKLVKIEEDDTSKGPQFASILKFFKIYMQDDVKWIIAKFQVDNDDVREFLKINESFSTETVMYKEYLPILGAGNKDIFPKCYYGFSSGGKDVNKDLIVLEDLGKDGYRVSTENVFLDKDHVLLAMKKIGEFHALSYLAKKRGDIQYSKLYQTRFARSDKSFEKTVILSMSRGVNALLPKCSEIDQKKLEKILKISDTKQLAARLCEPEEPYAVITHGDFNRNNVLYKYENNTPVNIKFFDLQTAIYSSPAIDLAFFLYMNTNKNVREVHWDEFLETYWKAVTKSVDPGFSYEQFLDDFGKRAIYGYFLCSFFLPAMLDTNVITLDFVLAMTEEERCYRSLNCGGEEATEAVTSIVEHLLVKGYLDKFLNSKIHKDN